MRIAKLCLAFLAIATCVLVRPVFLATTGSEFAYVMWAVACNVAACVGAVLYFRRARTGDVAPELAFGPMVLTTLGVLLPSLLFKDVLKSTNWTGFSLFFVSMAPSALCTLASWFHMGLWIVTRPAGYAPTPTQAAAASAPGRGWEVCKGVFATTGAALVLWTLASESGPSLVITLVEAALAVSCVGCARTFFRRVHLEKALDRTYFAEGCVALFLLACSIPPVAHAVLPEFPHAGAWLILFSCLCAGGPAFLATMVQLDLETSQTGPAPTSPAPSGNLR